MTVSDRPIGCPGWRGETFLTPAGAGEKRRVLGEATHDVLRCEPCGGWHVAAQSVLAAEVRDFLRGVA